MKKNITPLLITLAIFTACGKGGHGGSSSASDAPAIQEQQSEGSYRAILRPLNNSLSGYLPSGFAHINISANNVEIKTLLDDDAKVEHIQSIHFGTRCPNMSDDKNGDGLVDIDEAMAITGEVFIPLDSDLSSEEAGEGVYPVGRSFTYTETATLEGLEKDVKARTGQNLNLGGRVIMLHGAPNNAKVPVSMRSFEGSTPQASAPIACGVIYRI